jgi:hypothetical protein
MSRLNLILNDNLSWHDRNRWNNALSLLRDLFNSSQGALSQTCLHAHTLKEQIDAVDHFIQKSTSQVCPECQKVCCINRHGYYDYQDLIYITALGLTPPRYRDGIEDTDPCQFLSDSGCTIARSLRPFRCNWHFCPELIDSMSAGPAKPLREFNLQFQKLQAIRHTMLDLFFDAISHENNMIHP